MIAGLVFLAAPQPLFATSAAVQTRATGAALAALRGDTIAEAAPARRIYYTWTTPDQLTELRQNPRLFHGDERDRPASVFSFTAGVLVYEDHEAAQLSAELRAAWPPVAEEARGG